MPVGPILNNPPSVLRRNVTPPEATSFLKRGPRNSLLPGGNGAGALLVKVTKSHMYGFRVNIFGLVLLWDDPK